MEEFVELKIVEGRELMSLPEICRSSFHGPISDDPIYLGKRDSCRGSSFREVVDDISSFTISQSHCPRRKDCNNSRWPQFLDPRCFGRYVQPHRGVHSRQRFPPVSPRSTSLRQQLS